MTETTDIRRKRLLYQATYRGFKEADLLIGGFAKAHIAEMSEEDLDEFEALLKINDRELYAYATGNAEPPEGCSNSILEALKLFDLAENKSEA